jgi:hypothetical protein
MAPDAAIPMAGCSMLQQPAKPGSLQMKKSERRNGGRRRRFPSVLTARNRRSVLELSALLARLDPTLVPRNRPRRGQQAFSVRDDRLSRAVFPAFSSLFDVSEM